MHITLTVINFDRRKLYGTQRHSSDGASFTFWLSEDASSSLVAIFKSLEPDDNVMIGYELVKVWDYPHKIIRSIVKEEPIPLGDNKQKPVEDHNDAC